MKESAYMRIWQKNFSKDGKYDRFCRHIGTEFFSYFDENTVRKMKDILESGRYIPQEILNTADFIPAKTYKM